MFHIVLYQPEIPPNTGNIIRLCANSGAHLHLIHPLGFQLEDKKLKRAGLDYSEWTRIAEYADLEAFYTKVQPRQVYAFSAKAQHFYHQVRYKPEAALLFGPETRGLPPSVLQNLAAEALLKIPMQPGSRSLNLSNAVAIVVYEALRQQDFATF